MITKQDAEKEHKSSLSGFEIAIPVFDLAILAILFQLDLPREPQVVHDLYQLTFVLTLVCILLIPVYSLRFWSESRLKRNAFNGVEKYKAQLLEMARKNDTSSKLGDQMDPADVWSTKMHVLDVKITSGLIKLLVPLFFLNVAAFLCLTYLLKLS